MKVSFNGRIVDEGEAKISITDKAVWYDFGVYESVKVLQGKVMWPQMHVERFFRSAELIGMNMGWDKGEVMQWIHEFAAAMGLKDHLIKMCAYGDADKNEQARVFMFALGLTFYPDKYYKDGVRAITYQGERHFPNSKSFDILLNFLAHREAREKGAFDALLVDRDGNVREGTSTNLFIVEHRTVITPPLTDVLEGVTRIHVMKLLRDNKIPIQEERVSAERLLKSDEVFITATSPNILPVTQVNDQAVRDGKVGEVVKNVMKLFREMQLKFVKS